MADKRMVMRDIFESSIMHALAEKNPGFEIEAQRVFLALILIADDYGRGRLIYQNIRIKAFGSTPLRYVKIDYEMIKKWVSEIESQGALITYEFDEAHYFALTGWDKYQSGKWYRQPSNLPAPPIDENENEDEGKGEKSPKNEGVENVDSERVETENSSTTDKENPRKKKKKVKELTLEERRRRKDLIIFCRKIVPKKCGIPSQLKKQMEALERLVTKDQKNLDVEKLMNQEQWQEHVFNVLEWARSDNFEKHSGTGGRDTWNGWDSIFQSIPPLRTNGYDKFIKIQAAYQIDLAKQASQSEKKMIDDRDKFGHTGVEEL